MQLLTRFVLLLLLLGAAEVSTVSGAAPIKNLTVCQLTVPERALFHAHYAVQYYAPQFPEIQWSSQLLGHLTTIEPYITARSIVTAWVINGTQCNILIGPGWSFLAIALSPLVEIPWIGYGATSTELSDTVAHPTFSRVIPTDDVIAKIAGTVMRKLGWLIVSVYCINDPYGRSLAAGLSAALDAVNGTIDVQRCLLPTSSMAEITEAHDDLMAGESRIIYIATYARTPMFTQFMDVVKKKQSYKNHVFFTGEDHCSTSIESWSGLQSALCVTYQANETMMQPFVGSYINRDTSALEMTLRNAGFTDEMLVANLNSTDFWGTMGHDAALFAMASMTAYYTSGSTEDPIKFLREFNGTVGATGHIRLDAHGDRLSMNAVLYNVVPQGSEFGTVAVGTIQEDQFALLTPTTQLYLMGSFHDQSAIPPAVVPLPEVKSGLSSGVLAVIITLSIAVVAGVAAVVIFVLLRKPAPAVPPPQGPTLPSAS